MQFLQIFQTLYVERGKQITTAVKFFQRRTAPYIDAGNMIRIIIAALPFNVPASDIEFRNVFCPKRNLCTFRIQIQFFRCRFFCRQLFFPFEAFYFDRRFIGGYHFNFNSPRLIGIGQYIGMQDERNAVFDFLCGFLRLDIDGRILINGDILIITV